MTFRDWLKRPLVDVLPAALIGVVSPKGEFGPWGMIALGAAIGFGIGGNFLGAATLRFTRGLRSEFADQGWASLATSAILIGAGLVAITFTPALYVPAAALCALSGVRGLWWTVKTRQALHGPATDAREGMAG